MRFEKLTGKELMTAGIFTAITVVLGMISAMTLSAVPIGFLCIGLISPIICGIPMMLYMSKIKKFGMLMIMAAINGTMLLMTGMGWEGLAFGLAAAFLAELVIGKGGYSSRKMNVLSDGVYSLAAASNYIHWINATDEFIAQRASAYGEDFINTTVDYFKHSWMMPLVIVMCFAGGVIGGLFGNAVLKKHFEKSGLL
ncbi:MAG: MptD family putative ECF transporter S component [Ruminococcus sp.]|nr:MptD family putative ECF transporter S component [Ruminococcus sp.]